MVTVKDWIGEVHLAPLMNALEAAGFDKLKNKKLKNRQDLRREIFAAADCMWHGEHYDPIKDCEVQCAAESMGWKPPASDEVIKIWRSSRKIRA